MSAVVVLAPLVVAAWPAVAAAAVGALTSMGYSRSSKKVAAPDCPSVRLEVPSGAAIAEDLGEEGSLAFQKGKLLLEVTRGKDGRCEVRASGKGLSEEELRAAGKQAMDGIVQQYAYHRLVSELKGRGFEVVEESVEKDRSIKMRVRQWKA